MSGVSIQERVKTYLKQEVAIYRKKTYKVFYPSQDDEWERYVDWFIMSLIAANVAAVMLGTVDPFQNRYGKALQQFEIFSVTVFSIEYLARIWSGVEGKENLAELNPIFDRIKIAGHPMMVIDLLAILPFFLTRVGLGLDLRFLRALRLIRFLRLLKLVRYSESMRAFGRAFRKKKDELIVAMTANGLLLVVASSLMYFVEHDSQPGVFGSIPETMWWGIITLTTVG
ncbi:ion transporter [Natronoglomus mannanivorans]|uniref:Ion transporter n=1 Tax=Natronoglomus mannanivorans TaxID=2979990 RepID=A0AAP2Z423_9EURY|nr:ion transporter [Halobacteria archaeon AArc-xg1-1]